jgi:hypothetical protein
MTPLPFEQRAWVFVIPGGLKARPGIQSHKSVGFALDSRSLASRAIGNDTEAIKRISYDTR